VDAGQRAQQLLENALGEKATFHEGQREAILALAEQRGRVLVVQRTGWGKSVVYFLATRILRDEGSGPTILISPLLALMRDQLLMAKRFGVRAVKIDSTNSASWDEIDKLLAADEVDLLLISPERLANEKFRRRTLDAIKAGIGMFVVDEAHCISDWGHDFRPDYQRIRALTQTLPAGVPLLATTATANNRVIADVEAQLGPNLNVVRGPLGRDSLYLEVIHLEHQAERLAWLSEYMQGTEGSGIVYTLTVRDAERVSKWLAGQGIEAPAYHGQLKTEQREALEEDLRRNRVKALVATIALGMGFDKPDLAFVVHFQMPSSAITYYQQIGRAGRGVERAEVVLLCGAEDKEIANYFIDGAFPAEETMRQIIEVLEDVDAASLKQIEDQVNVRQSVIKDALQLLEVAGAVIHEGSKYVRTPNEWTPNTEQIEAVTQTRQAELEQMIEFSQTDGCLMEFITAQLDDPVRKACGRCANCAGSFAPGSPETELVREAELFLRRSHVPIGPRKMWKGDVEGWKGKIPEEQVLQEGMALAYYGSAGWGAEIKAGKYDGDGFSDRLVEAVAEMIEENLKPDPPATWVTAVPSRRAPKLVPDFAERLADRLGLPYRSALIKVSDTPPQKEMENSPKQARNAIASFGAEPDEILPEPVILVDDMIDSGWSLTVCGALLARAGSGPVFPVVLGVTSAS
jgi:ATP-dependent DNA helicase RecQ